MAVWVLGEVKLANATAAPQASGGAYVTMRSNFASLLQTQRQLSLAATTAGQEL